MNESLWAMIKEIRRGEDLGYARLSEWEEQFLVSVSRYLQEEKPLTPKQEQKLVDIWKRVTA